MAGSGINNKVAIMRIIAFGLLSTSVFVDIGDFNKVINDTLTDPFWLGAFGMFIAWIISYKNGTNKINGRNITHLAMTIFILTKIISHSTHSKDYSVFGKVY